MTGINPGTLRCLFDAHEFAHATGVALRGFALADKGHQWQFIIRGRRRDGTNVYCMFVAVDLVEAVEGLFKAVTGKGGSRYWYLDKYAK